jgi:hypothetical protein
MGNAQKMMIAVAGVFAIGFYMVGANKDVSDDQRKSASMIRDVANMQRIAHKRCLQLIEEHTGKGYAGLVSRSESDKSTYLTLEWEGGKDDNFKDVSCTVSVVEGGISEFIVDGKTIIDKGKDD